MILYHGSNAKASNPELIKSDKGRDYGIAFYLTPIKSQAERWAKRKHNLDKSGKPIVSVFEFKEDDSLIYKKYANADMEWLDLIVSCRLNTSYRHGYDIVEGKIADDNVGETILFVINGTMRKEDAIERLKFQKINIQIAFCSEESLKSLKFIKSYEVK